MADRDRERRDVAKAAVGALHHNDFRQELKIDSPRLEVPILVALYDDPVSMFFDLAEPIESGFLVVLGPDRELIILKFTPSEGSDHPVHDDEDECPIHPDSEIGMLVEYIRSVGGPVRCSIYCPDCEIDVVDGGDHIEVPA